MRCFLSSLALLSALVIPAAAHADTIDQQNTTYTYGSSSNSAVGQSFTPTMNTLTFASFALKGNNNSVVDVKLLQGAGMGGKVLGTSNSLTLADCGFDWYTFSFSPVTLAVGSLYTLEVNLVSGGSFQELFSASGYTGGMAFGTSGTSYPGYDLTFTEGGYNKQVTPTSPTSPAVAATPEPSSLALMGTGALSLAGMLRRRMRRA